MLKNATMLLTFTAAHSKQNKMKKKKKIIFISILTLVLLSGLYFAFPFNVLANSRPLEITYPEIPGAPTLTTTKTILPDYVKYIYYFAISFAGLIALISLIIGGLKFLSSAGNPQRISDARNQIISALIGITILFASFIIVSKINPSLLSPKETKLPEITLSPPSMAPITYMPTADLLTRIKILAQTIQKAPDETKKIITSLQSLMQKCKCSSTKAICLCTTGAPGGKCQPRRCFAGNNKFNPCPDYKKITETQKLLVDWRDVILYYRTRALAEKDDLGRDISLYVTKKILWYEEKIKERQKISEKLPPGAQKQGYQKEIDHFTEIKNIFENEKNYKEELMKKLEKLGEVLAQLEPKITSITLLPNQCITDVGVKCIPTCKSGGLHGCHDALKGCESKNCVGGNPCPLSELQNEIKEVDYFNSKIVNICGEIIKIVENIKEKQPIFTNI